MCDSARQELPQTADAPPGVDPLLDQALKLAGEDWRFLCAKLPGPPVGGRVTTLHGVDGERVADTRRGSGCGAGDDLT